MEKRETLYLKTAEIKDGDLYIIYAPSQIKEYKLPQGCEFYPVYYDKTLAGYIVKPQYE